jgi:glycosyltransferase
MQKHLFDGDFGLAGLAGLYPFLAGMKCDKNAERSVGSVTEINKDSVNLYIFNETSRAAVYGIGTYINELTLCLKDVPSINLNIVKLNDECKEFTIETSERTTYWKIPGSRYYGNDYEKQHKLYYQSVVTILRQYIPSTENMIAHFNYIQNLPLLEIFTAIFNCKSVIAIHYMSWCFSLQGNLSRLKTILSKNENDSDNFEKNIRKSFEQEQMLLKKVDFIISLANYTSTVLSDEYEINPSKTVTVYNGLHDSTHKISLKEKKKLKQKYNIGIDEIIIIFAGRLDTVKGLDVLMGAFKKVLKHKLNSRLIIAGDGNFSEYLRKGEDIWTKTTFTGRIDRTKLFELYSIADIGIMPSMHEQCSYTAIEMMMHGLPLIVSTTTGLGEMVEENVSGLHIPVREYEDKVEISENLLSEKILYLLDNPEILCKMGNNARKRYLENYSADVFKENMLKTYRLVMK